MADCTKALLVPVLRLPFSYHIVIGLLIRLFLIVYATIQDEAFHIKYTDVDYTVFTDAARHVMKGGSPYDRHTYRYTPIIAWLMLPNVFFNENFGKVLFCVCDVIITLVIRSFVILQVPNKLHSSKIAKYSALFWLYNPLGIVISTRGNADSVSCLTIILSLFFLQSPKYKSNIKYVLSGIFLGLSIHMRIYPIIFSLPMYLSLGEYNITRDTNIATGLKSLIPNKKQLALVISTIVSFVVITYGMYLIYGHKFLFETYIYHLFRKDTRHNFSVLFYTSYLSMGDQGFDILQFTTKILMGAVLIILSLVYGCQAYTLPFAVFCQAAVLVIYNSVVTSQYFIWYLSLLPLIVHDIKAGLREASVMFMMWAGGQGSWLVSAYFLEYMNQPVFLLIWVTGIMNFLSNVAVLTLFILMYTPRYNYGIPTKND